MSPYRASRFWPLIEPVSRSSSTTPCAVSSASESPPRRRRATRPCRFDRTEQCVGLVDDRDVGIGPRRVRDVVRARSVQELLLVVVEDAARGRANKRTKTEQIIDQFGTREHGPHPIEGFAHLRPAAETIGELAFPTLGQRFARRERAGDQRIGTGRRQGSGHRTATACCPIGSPTARCRCATPGTPAPRRTCSAPRACRWCGGRA